MAKRSLNTLNLAQRVEVIHCLDKNESQTSIASKFKVSQAAISRIKRDKKTILDDWQNNSNPDRKRKRASNAEDVEVALLSWFNQTRQCQLPVNGPLLKEKATQIAQELGTGDFHPSNGWLGRWKERNNITLKKHFEKQDVNESTAKLWITDVLPGIIKDYSPRNIFSADETGLFWRAVPDGTFTFKSVCLSGAEMAKNRITVLLCANMDGSEKLEPLIIGKCKQPRCFKNVKHLPTAYEGNAESWMTSDIWEKWLLEFDQKMRNEKRNVILLCDSCTVHTNNVRTTNVKCVFLPPNMTSIIQPLDQGIIASFKKHYRALVLQHLATLIDSECEQYAAELARRLSLLDTLHMLRQAWNKVTATTIMNCYKHAGFYRQDMDVPSLLDETVEYDHGQMTKSDFQLYSSFDEKVPVRNLDVCVVTPSTTLELTCTEGTDSDEDTDYEEIKSPSFSDAMRAFGVMRSWLQQNGSTSYDVLNSTKKLLYDTMCKNSPQLN